jgi:hypothetical protein
MKWTPEQLAELRRIYPDRTAEDCARALGRSVSSIRNAAFLNGLNKSSQFLNSERSGRISDLTRFGRAYRFPKGHATWNRGMKGLDIGGKQTRFKAGDMPHNHRTVGSERVDRDGILWRKATDTRRKSDWKAVHVIEWEKVNGALPSGKVVIFADGNRRNFDPSNLLAVTRGELMQRNTVHRYPKEIARLVQLRGVLNRQIRKRERDAKQDRRPA